MERYQEILGFWFGDESQAGTPSSERSTMWFSDDETVSQLITDKFAGDLARAKAGEYDDWKTTAHGCLGLIIILDQFSRKIHRESPEALAQDQLALAACEHGIRNRLDHELSLLERVFFYAPLVHSEELKDQHRALYCYQMVTNLSLPELKSVFDEFMDYVVYHYKTIERFGRFPDRNDMLGRETTESEHEYLQHRR